jgi:hypothetical protein
MIIAPRLFNGESRMDFFSRLPPNIKEGLRAIAKKEGKSMSWVIEEVIIDYFGLKRPRYKQSKLKLVKTKKRKSA